MKPTRITPEEYRTIVDHLEPLIDAARNGEQSMRDARRSLSSTAIEGQLKYWIHCRKSLEWAKSIALQRLQWSESSHVINR